MSGSTTRPWLLAWWLLAAGTVLASEFSGLALVNDDATLSIHNRRVRLWGIHIPRTSEDCQTYLRPAECGSHAVLALRQRVEGFVNCEDRARDGRVVEATCRVAASHFERGLDLAAYLVEQGWAVALDEAPVEYHVLERIARETGRGVWGVPGVLGR
jgi:endonuclease YncB( thermonuclease family)